MYAKSKADAQWFLNRYILDIRKKNVSRQKTIRAKTAGIGQKNCRRPASSEQNAGRR